MSCSGLKSALIKSINIVNGILSDESQEKKGDIFSTDLLEEMNKPKFYIWFTNSLYEMDLWFTDLPLADAPVEVIDEWKVKLKETSRMHFKLLERVTYVIKLHIDEEFKIKDNVRLLYKGNVDTTILKSNIREMCIYLIYIVKGEIDTLNTMKKFVKMGTFQPGVKDDILLELESTSQRYQAVIS